MRKHRQSFGVAQDHNMVTALAFSTRERKAMPKNKFKYRERQILCIRLKWNKVLYAWEWPLCHDLLRFSLCSDDLLPSLFLIWVRGSCITFWEKLDSMPRFKRRVKGPPRARPLWVRVFQWFFIAWVRGTSINLAFLINSLGQGFFYCLRKNFSSSRTFILFF